MDRKVDPDLESLASSFVSVSPTPSITTTITTAFDDPHELPPPYSAVPDNQDSANSTPSWTARDPRSSSMQSLHAATDVPQQNRRSLLLVYIHGFMGNETSFQGFPAHVHNLLTVLMSNSHIVHSKIYPRYRSKRPIQVATEDFSRWLEPHESPSADVILLGHSMGGLLSSEVVLLPARDPASGLRHRIAGSINFDTPFLGMHPRVIKAGLGSLFSPAPKPATSPQPGAASSYLASLVDGFSNLTSQNYNPTFNNDVNLPVRKGWDNAFHFVTKHSKNLRQATTQLITSHVEFGSCLADYEGLKARYCRIRMLEEDDARSRMTVIAGAARPPRRVRFANYYTASTGRPKKAKPQSSSSERANSPSPRASSTHRSGSDLTSRDRNPSSVTTLCSGSQAEISDISTIASLSDLEDLEESSTRSEPAVALSTSPANETGPIDIDQETTALPPPPPPPPPSPRPNKQMFLDDVDAFKHACMTHRADLKAYTSALKEYHDLYRAHRRAENERYHRDVKDTIGATTLDANRTNSSPNPDEDPSRTQSPTAATAATSTDRRAELRSLKERLRQENQANVDQLKKQWTEEKARRKAQNEAVKARREAGKQAAEAGCKADPEQIKSVYDVRKAECKHLKKQHEKGGKRCKHRINTSCSSNGQASSTRSSTSTPAPSATSRTATAEDRGRFGCFLPGKPSGPSQTSGSAASSTTTLGRGSSACASKKDRKFCILPPADSSGQHDQTWHRIYMPGVDEVGAHCGLFFSHGAGCEELPSDGSTGRGWGERYARLVGDVAERIEGWVLDSETQRLVQENGA